MNGVPRQTLRQLIAIYGLSLCDNPLRCKSLLLDLCGKYRREINLLINVLEEHIIVDLLNAPKGIPYEVLRARLVRRLHDDRGLAENYAGWAVDSWALALDIEIISPYTRLPEEELVTSQAETSSANRILPGSKPSPRPLHFIWIIDCSSSMHGDKIQSLNTAIRETIPELRRVAADNPYAQVLIRVITFSTHSRWHIVQPTPIENFTWIGVTAGGKRNMGEALFKVAEQLDVSLLGQRGLPPVLVLISDGYPSDSFESGLNALMAQPWWKKSVRLAIGIGGDADYNMLQKFIGNPEIKPCQANNPDALVQYIKWASTAAIQVSSAPNIQNVGAQLPRE